MTSSAFEMTLAEAKETQLRVPDPCPYLGERIRQDAEVLRWFLSMSVRFCVVKKGEGQEAPEA
jgi:hypothetical protein